MLLDEPESRGHIGHPHSVHGPDRLHLTFACEHNDDFTISSPDVHMRWLVLSRGQEDDYAESSGAEHGWQEEYNLTDGLSPA